MFTPKAGYSFAYAFIEGLPLSAHHDIVLPHILAPRIIRWIMTDTLENICLAKGLKMTGQRRVIARALSSSDDHPDVELLYQRSNAIDSNISIATVYRTVKLFEEAGIIERHDFGDGRSRYEAMGESHHDHLINLKTGEVIEFTNEKIEKLQEIIAHELGYRLVDHRLELYAVPLEND